MLVRNENINNVALLGIKRITGNRDELLGRLTEKQQEEAAIQISSMASDRRVMEWLTTRVMLLEMLGRDIAILNNEEGKPYLSDYSYNISISHSVDYVAVLLSKDYRVGVDIEKISERIFKIKERFVSNKEFIAPENSLIHLLLHWSAKETMFKFLNEVEVDFKDHLFIHPFDPKDEGVLEATEYKTNANKTYQINYELFEDNVLTWLIDK